MNRIFNNALPFISALNDLPSAVLALLNDNLGFAE
jgi:hypothetical protein